MSLIVFSHANSFPAATYSVMFKNLRSRGFTVKAVDKFGHAPEYPVTDNWRHLVQQLHDFAAQHVEKQGEPAFLVGHSLGGFLSLMCAARHPHLAKGVLLLDSPLLGGWKATALGAMKRTQTGRLDLAGPRQPPAQEPLADVRGRVRALPPQEGFRALAGAGAARLRQPLHPR